MTENDISDFRNSVSDAYAGTKYSRKYFLHYYDCDWRRRLTVFSMLRYFEDSAMLQSEKCEIGLDFYEKNNVAWLLTGWDVRIRQRPLFGDTVLVSTRPLAFRNMLATRRFTIDHENGERYVDAMSYWIYFDTARRRPKRIDKAIFAGYGISAESPSLHVPPLLELPHKEMEIREFNVRMSDIDHNGHVNNIRYVEWGLEALPERIRQHGNMIALKVQFRRETHYGQSVFVKSAWTERDGQSAVSHVITSDGEVACLLHSVWVE